MNWIFEEKQKITRQGKEKPCKEDSARKGPGVWKSPRGWITVEKAGHREATCGVRGPNQTVLNRSTLGYSVDHRELLKVPHTMYTP